MAIDFKKLPETKPGMPLIDKGTYRGKIIEAVMKPSKSDSSKPPYLNLTFQLVDKDTGKPVGKLYDILTESDNDYARYKLKRFIETLGLPLEGTLHLSDLTKIAKNVEMLIDVSVDEKSDPPRSQVDIFTGDIYYPLESAEGDAPINASDAEDETPFTTEPSNVSY